MKDWKEDFEKQKALNTFVPPQDETIGEAMKKFTIIKD